MYERNILSIDGGGVRGIIALEQLMLFEQTLSQPLSKHFDLITGTSTGGIIAAMLATGVTAEAILEFYYRNIEAIFAKNFFRRGIFRPKYSDKAINDVLFKHLGNKTIGSLETNMFVPIYDNISKKTICIHSMDTKFIEYKLYDIIRGTVAAPTYFKSHKFNGYEAIDGGISMSNPSLYAFELLKQVWGPTSKINMLSLSTGSSENTVSSKYGQGMLKWFIPTTSINDE